jgi:hypothetical protein
MLGTSGVAMYLQKRGSSNGGRHDGKYLAVIVSIWQYMLVSALPNPRDGALNEQTLLAV